MTLKWNLDRVKILACNKCQLHKSKTIELNQVIKKYKKGKICFESVLSIQRYIHDKCALGFFKFDKPSTSKKIFVKASTKFNNV